MMHTSTSSIIINKPVIKVWQALTDAELVRQWQFGTQLSTKWAVGGPIKFHNEWEGQSFDQWGEILEFSPYTTIKYSLFAPRPDLEDKPENYFYMTYSLVEQEGETTLTISREDPRPGAGHSEDDQTSGNQVLIALKQLVESL